MDFALMEQVAQGLQRVKPSKYVFCYAVTLSWALNCYAGHLPRNHMQRGEYCVKLSKEAVQAFKQCFPEGTAPEVKIRA
jgi:hypothetical protein